LPGSERDVTLVARPTISLLKLVEERRSARNKRHRAKLLVDDATGSGVARLERSRYTNARGNGAILALDKAVDSRSHVPRY
jgi:hypothetical protein